MSFIRVTVNDTESSALSDAEKSRLAQMRIKSFAPIQSPASPASVGVHILPDITGLPSSVSALAAEIITESSKKVECKFLRLPKWKISEQPTGEDTPTIDADAAYILTNDGLYYYNKNTDENIQIKNFTRERRKELEKLLQNKENTILSDEVLSSITKIIHHLHENKRPVSIFSDPNIFNGQYVRNILSIENETEAIINNLRSKYPKGPYVLVAYSYSSLLAIEIMQEMARKGLDCFVYVIDAPAPELSKQLLNKNKDGYDHTLLEIVNYTARLCNLREININSLTQEFNEKLNSLTPGDVLDKLGEYALSINPYTTKLNQDNFKMYMGFIRLRIEKLANYRKEFIKPINGTLQVTLTDKTVEKYKAEEFLCGWYNYATNLNYTGYKCDNPEADPKERTYSPDLDQDTSYLLSKDHHTILTDPRSLKILARDINAFIDKNITEEYLANYNFQNWINGAEVFAKGNPQIKDLTSRLKAVTTNGKLSPPLATGTASPMTASPIVARNGGTTAALISAMQEAPVTAKKDVKQITPEIVISCDEPQSITPPPKIVEQPVNEETSLPRLR